MKKLLGVLCAGMLLAGCSGGGEPVTKTCTSSLGGKMDMEWVLEGTSDTLEKATMKINIAYDAIGIDKDSSEEEKEKFDKETKQSIIDELEDGDVTGLDVTSGFDDNGWNMSISAEASMLEKAVNSTSMDEAVKEVEGQGFTCK